MTTNTPDSEKPAGSAETAVTAILADWSSPASGTPPVAPAPPAPPASPASVDTSVASAAARPTVRWGAIVWALLYGSAAATTLWILIDPSRRDSVGGWLTTLSPLTATLYAVVALGVIVALFGIVGLIRRGERARR
ncbi:hypothetical protein [Agromyces subbeticus]|uniref:hypothetical protein n=1 Tax=Agromyces subbeticus TaxID=293890 RepID=UPI0003B723A2|nr:hypothetical protein [Agromyces subbeticus]